ncbi:hypothetical protein [Streptomyces sp. NPDC020362]
MTMVALPFAGGHTRLATAHHDEDDDGHVVYLWDTVTGEQVGGPLPGPEFASGLAALPMPDGRNLPAIAPCEDEEVWLWDAATAERVIAPLRAPAGVDGPSALTAVTPVDGRTCWPRPMVTGKAPWCVCGTRRRVSWFRNCCAPRRTRACRAG